jgi:hypothetical protein
VGLVPTPKTVIGQFVNGRNAGDDFLQLVDSHGGNVLGWIDANGVLQGSLAAGGGTIAGSIAATQIAVGSGANTIAGSPNFIKNSNNGIQIITTAGPSPALFFADLGAQTAGEFFIIQQIAPSAIAIYNSVNGIGVTGFALNEPVATFLPATILPGSLWAFTPANTSGLVVGQNGGGAQGRITFLGQTTGQAAIVVANVAGNPNDLVLPITTGTSGQVLSTSGANPQQLSWVTAGTLIASGTATLPTGALPANTSSAATTVAGAGILATDAIEWSFNAAPGTGYTEGVFVAAYPTAGNVNFIQTNPTAGSRTPAAATLNWRVIR